MHKHVLPFLVSQLQLLSTSHQKHRGECFQKPVQTCRTNTKQTTWKIPHPLETDWQASHSTENQILWSQHKQPCPGSNPQTDPVHRHRTSEEIFLQLWKTAAATPPTAGWAEGVSHRSGCATQISIRLGVIHAESLLPSAMEMWTFFSLPLSPSLMQIFQGLVTLLLRIPAP